MWNQFKAWWQENVEENVKGVGTATLDLPVSKSLDPRPEPSNPPALVRNISTSLKRDDAPEFERTYKASLIDGVSCEIAAESRRWRSGRTFRGTLRQSGGEYVFFDPDNIARKIIDRSLLPLVIDFVMAVKQMDSDFMRTSTDRFTDTDGVAWVRSGARMLSDS